MYAPFCQQQHQHQRPFFRKNIADVFRSLAVLHTPAVFLSVWIADALRRPGFAFQRSIQPFKQYAVISS